MSTTERETSIEAMPRILDPRVERGAALLDETTPGWAERINLDTLDTGSVYACPLGQVYGGFGIGTGTLWPEMRGESLPELFRDHGFYTFHHDHDHAAVQQDWRLAILSRRDA